MIEEILALAATLGGVGEGDKPALRKHCEGAERELAERLKSGILPTDCAPAFVLGAAWLALSDLCVGECVDGISAFSAGGLSVQERGGTALERSGALRRRAELVMAPYIRDSGFLFLGVNG